MELNGFVASPHQVAGHLGTLSNEDGSIFAKLTTQQEIDFYNKQLIEDTQDGASRELGSRLKDWMPEYIGVLEQGITKELEAVTNIDPETKEKLLNQVQLAGALSAKDKSKYILLENVLQGYKRPSIMDIKLGDLLYDSSLSADKRLRMIKVSETTTSGSMKFRICGMKIQEPASGLKELARSLKELASDHFTIEDGYLVVNKLYGRSLSAENVVEGFKLFFQGNSLDKECQMELLKMFHIRLQMLYNCLLDLKIEVISGSLLFVYESEVDKWQDEEVDHEIIYSRMISDEEEEDEEQGEEEMSKLSSLHFIDFAHAKEAAQADERIISGVENLIKVIEEIIEETEEE